ncbi:MAG TPA: hypothetical protein VI385_09355 [Flavisolibacter sp.]
MKLSLILLFLTILLLCGVLLRAANNNCKVIKMKYVQEDVTEAEVKDMQLFPNVVLL